jgi:hypothetical protein
MALQSISSVSLIQITTGEPGMGSERFVAVGLLTRRDLDVLGSGFRAAFPLKDTTDFTSLLARIDEVADARERWRNQSETTSHADIHYL